MSAWYLTSEEQRVLNLLVEAWEAFQELPEQHPEHALEFMHAIRAAQRLVITRSVARATGAQDVETGRGPIT